MIVVRFPNVLTRNFEGDCDYVPSWLSDLFIDEAGEEGYDILESIRDAILATLQDNRYGTIYNLCVSEYQNDMLSLHFQVPRYNIDQDSMEYDDRPISYHGVIRYGQMEGNTEDYIL